MRIKLGAKVRDLITGFSGVATIVADHLTGCRRYWVEGAANAEGKSTDLWFDESRLEVIDAPIELYAEEVAAHPSPSDCSAPREDPRP